MILNTIQQQYLDRLEILSAEKKVELTTTLSGVEEPYLTGNISDYTFWVYQDGDSTFSSYFFDRRFEGYDFSDQNDLVGAFINSLSDAIERKGYFRAHPDKSPDPIFNRLFDWFRDYYKKF